MFRLFGFINSPDLYSNVGLWGTIAILFFCILTSAAMMILFARLLRWMHGKAFRKTELTIQKCPSCGKESIGTRSQDCPNCGYRFNTK